MPVVTALQFKKSFKQTILYAELISVFSVVSGIFLSFYLNLATGGVIVLIALSIFIATTLLRS
jgi:zinc transport system permease protein